MIAKGATRLACERPAVRRADRRRAARAGARGDHRDRRASTASRRSTTSRSSKAPASTTARRRWRRSSASARRSSSSAAATPPARRRCFSRRPPRRVHMLVRGRRTGRHDVALPDSPHRGQPRDRAAHAHARSSRLEGERAPRARDAGATTGPASVETHAIRHVFMMTGAVPNTGWLDGCVALDDKGFIKTGPDLSPDDLSAAPMAAGAPAVSARNESSRRLRRRRRARRQHQARRVRRRRRIDCRRLRPSGASPVGKLAAHLVCSLLPTGSS